MLFGSEIQIRALGQCRTAKALWHIVFSLYTDMYKVWTARAKTAHMDQKPAENKPKMHKIHINEPLEWFIDKNLLVWKCFVAVQRHIIKHTKVCDIGLKPNKPFYQKNNMIWPSVAQIRFYFVLLFFSKTYVLFAFKYVQNWTGRPAIKKVEKCSWMFVLLSREHRSVQLLLCDDYVCDCLV